METQEDSHSGEVYYDSEISIHNSSMCQCLTFIMVGMCAVGTTINKVNLDLFLGRHYVAWSSLLNRAIAAPSRPHDHRWKPLMFHSTLCYWARVLGMWDEFDMY